MSTVANYNPLKRIRMPGTVIEDPAGLIIVIGPNSSGKTLFLKDIQNLLSGAKEPPVVCKSFAVNKPTSLGDYLKDLVENNLLMQMANNSYLPYVSTLTEQTPQNQSREIQTFDMQSMNQAYQQMNLSDGGNNQAFFNFLGPVLVASLTLEMRRHICDQSPSFDWQKTRPAFPLQALHINTQGQDRLAEETGKVFGNVTWLDTVSKHNIYQLKVSATPHQPTRGETNNPITASRYWSIQKEGDGYKSYVGICLSLLVGIRPVSLIDEPELCLHPPQAYHIGRFVGEFASRQHHVTFVATHSSHVLRGMLETGERLRIVRMTRIARTFQAHMLDENDIRHAVKNARTRVEAILDGLFAQAVVIVESEGDREVCQAASEAVKDYAAREVHFVHSGGTGGFLEILRFYRTLNIPVAVIADLDTLADVPKVAEAVRTLSPDGKGDEGFVTTLRDLVNDINQLPPAPTPDEVKAELKAIAELPMNWKGGDDNVVGGRLNKLVNLIKRLQKLKDGGINSYNERPDIQARLRSAVETAKSFGLFFVEGGEVEDWVTHLMKDYPKGAELSKLERAIIAAERIRNAENKTGDVWAFIEAVLKFLHLAKNDTIETVQKVRERV